MTIRFHWGKEQKAAAALLAVLTSVFAILTAQAMGPQWLANAIGWAAGIFLAVVFILIVLKIVVAIWNGFKLGRDQAQN